MERHHCFVDVKKHRQAVDAATWAVALAPGNRFYVETLKQRLNDWHRALFSRRPPHFPQIAIEGGRRLFPDTLSVDIEKNILGLMAMENMLNTQEQDRNWWAPLRRGAVPRTPAQAVVAFAPDLSCTIDFRFSSPAH
jgi:hypothetical protein